MILKLTHSPNNQQAKGKIMGKWVTLDEVKHHLRYDDESNDLVLEAYIRASEAAVNRYITDDMAAEDTPDIKVAVLLLVGYYDYHRNASSETPNFGNYLPDSVRALLWPYRTPTAE